MKKKDFQHQAQVHSNNYKKGVKSRKKGKSLTTHTLGLSLRRNHLSLLLVIYHFLPSTSTPQSVKVSHENERG